MGIDHRINAVTMAAALLCAVLLGGCSYGSYEKITAAETTVQQAENAEGNLEAERIGEADAGTGIILETEDQNAGDFLRNDGESGQNPEGENSDEAEASDDAANSVNSNAAADSMTILFSGRCAPVGPRLKRLRPQQAESPVCWIRGI